MDTINLLLFFAFIINLSLLTVIYLRAQKTRANILFLITAFGITAWCLAMILYRTASPDTVVLWAKLLYFFPTFIPAAFLLFGMYFPKQKVSKTKITIIAIATTLMATFTLIDDALIKSVTIVQGRENEIQFGWAYYYLYNIYHPVFFISSYIILIKKYIAENSYRRMQILYILLGMTAASVPPIFTNLLLPTFGYFTLNWVGQIFTIFWISGVAYAIVKHRFINIKLVIARSIAYSLLVLVLGFIYAIGLFFAASYITGETSTSGSLIISTILALSIAFSFQPLRRYFEKVTDKVFYKDKYESEAFLGKMSKIMSSNFELTSLSNNLLEEIINTLKSSKCAIVLTSKSTRIIQKERSGENILSNQSDNSECKQLISEVAENSQEQMFVLDELEELNQKELMQKHNASIVVALQAEDEVVGGILLGEKSSGDMYSSQDIEVLKILAPEIAIAVKNALSTEEIKRFNTTLKEEVERATTDLKKANNRLEQLDKLKDEFVSLASHELRTPLTVIKSYIWMILQEKNGKLNKIQRDQLEKTLFTSDHLINLVNDMLNISRIESGRIELKKTEINLKELINNIVEGMKQRADELKINLSLEKVREHKVNADPSKIQQVLINIIGNALKFTPSGGSISIFTEERNNEVVVGIKDSGVGIRKEDISKLFQKFSTVGGSFPERKNAQSTGLGLYLSKSIIELHGGQMWVESEGEGKGSTFFFTLKK